MKLILAAIMAVALAGCAGTPKVGPKPNLAPVKTANDQTISKIKQTRAHIKKVRDSLKTEQEHAAKGATALEKADDLLTQMLKK